MERTDYHWSRFNFITKNSRGYYLYNSYSNCLLGLDPEMASICMALRDNCDELDSFIGSLSKEELDYFVQNSILVISDDDLVENLHLHSMARLFSRKTLVLTIAPTQSCNFACSYCYEHFRKSSPMDDATAESIIKYVKYAKDNDGLEVLYLTWYGGEPLLQVDRVCSLSSQLSDMGLKIKENNIITNGFFLNDASIKKLISAGINEIQVTLDGDRDTHNKRRPLLNGNGSYDRIIENLDNFFSKNYDQYMTLAIRVNIDRNNYSDYYETYQWFRTRYKGHQFIIYPGIIVLDENDSCSHTCFSRNEVTDIFINLYKKYGIISEKIYPDSISIECKARSPYANMLIGSRGEIYKCFEDLGIEDRIVGNINDPIKWSNFKEIARYATGIDHYLSEECRKCPYIPICNGGCPRRRYENLYENKHNDCCTPFKGRIDDYIDIFLTQKEK